ncbi:hypothetical protein Mhun_0997 [Methanospirillum hungatei JF-1]|uniref:Uncharacterized protein n=2 Tax=Methanospirillum hungatei TaxID=2203 RepID=Q2FPL3_METHJ|nr:hypothetical protein Mhun_0997 [Methanospirillum hungatei JF-1]
MKALSMTESYYGYTRGEEMKTAISMPDELYNAVKEYTGDKPFSTTICELIRKALYGEVIPNHTAVIPSISPGELEEIKERISTLEAWREEVLESHTYVIPEVIPTVEESAPIVEEVIPEVIPTVEEVIPTVETTIPGDDEPIPITPSMRAEMIKCIERFVSHGHMQKEAAQKIGMPIGSFNKIGNEKHPLVNIRPSWYRAILRLS